MNAPLRLTPTMRSRKLLALEFIRQFWAKHNHSPSLSEIGAALGGVPSSSVLNIVKRLAAEKLIDHRGGPRGIVLPCAQNEALRILAAAGYTIGVGIRTIVPPPAPDCTNPTLPMLIELDHIPYRNGGDQHDDSGERR